MRLLDVHPRILLFAEIVECTQFPSCYQTIQVGGNKLSDSPDIFIRDGCVGNDRCSDPELHWVAI